MRHHTDPPVRVLQLMSSMQVGGAEKLLVNLLESAQMDPISAAEIEYTVVVMNERINPELQRAIKEAGCTVYFLNRPEGHKHPRYLYQLLDIVRRHRIQVVHAHNYGSKLWAGLCKLLNPGLKLLVTMHGTTSVQALTPWQIWLHQRVIDHHIVISKAVESSCHQRGIYNTHHIYNGIPLKRFQQKPVPVFSSQTPLKILNIGRLSTDEKGHDILLKALKICKEEGLDFQCRIIGGVYEYNQVDYETLLALREQYNLSEAVEFLINRTDVPDLLSQGNLFILPSRHEGLGLVILEAMATGLPVIASKVDGPKELIQDGFTGLLFPSECPEILADKILFAHQNPRLMNQIQENASRFVRQFDISAMKEQYHVLYQNLVSEAMDSESLKIRRKTDGSPV